MSSNRYLEPGWSRIGRIDSAGRRSLWIRETLDSVELCAGREGDDAYVRITPENPQWRDLEDVLSRARFAAQFEHPDGFALEREAVARGEVMATEVPPLTPDTLPHTHALIGLTTDAGGYVAMTAEAVRLIDSDRMPEGIDMGRRSGAQLEAAALEYAGSLGSLTAAERAELLDLRRMREEFQVVRDEIASGLTHGEDDDATLVPIVDVRSHAVESLDLFLTRRVPTANYDHAARVAEKSASREQDAADLASGAKTREQLAVENRAFTLPRDRVRVALDRVRIPSLTADAVIGEVVGYLREHAATLAEAAAHEIEEVGTSYAFVKQQTALVLADRIERGAWRPENRDAVVAEPAAAPDDLAELEEAARSAAEDVAGYVSPRGTLTTYDDVRVGRMLARDPVIAKRLPVVLAELRRRRAGALSTVAAVIAGSDDLAELEECAKLLPRMIADLQEAVKLIPGMIAELQRARAASTEPSE